MTSLPVFFSYGDQVNRALACETQIPPGYDQLYLQKDLILI
jgi:hypothetical protein